MPQGSGSIVAEAGVTPAALNPASPAMPRKLRRDVSVFIASFSEVPILLLLPPAIALRVDYSARFNSTCRKISWVCSRLAKFIPGRRALAVPAATPHARASGGFLLRSIDQVYAAARASP